MRMTKKFRDSLKRNTKNTRLISEIPAQYLARLPIQTYARQLRRGSEICKTPGWEKRLMKSSPLQTERTWKSSLMLSRQYMVPRAQEPHHSLVQMELVFWLIKKLSWKDGLNTLTVSLIGHHPSMMKLSTDYHRWNVIRCLIPTVSETVKAIKLMSSGKAPGSDAIPVEIYKAGGPLVAEKLSYFTLCGEKKPSLKNSRMQQLSTYSKGKGILKPVTIIEASLYCQLLGRFLLGSYWIDWMNTWNGQGFYQKASVDSGKKTEEQ